ncbi:amidase [Salinimicrobium catena]|uniref:Amidase n=1 Tax=Salinimicrobium catena TaxID=390640 RepID=A0A1H5NT00_9FLAO|nr:amidase family protein [Salinimicrobium catena]SDL52157.1 amidase [Salinimicrobium catena]SEF04620.1 amidase [Salinimicrobium catena]
MKNLFFLAFLALTLFSCKSETEKDTEPAVVWERNDETAELEEQAQHEVERMQFKLINSKFLDKNTIWNEFDEELADFTEEKYDSLKPLILEQDIPQLQRAVQQAKLSYEELTKFYIYRIRKFESDNDLSLNAVIALNPDVVEDARELDARGKLRVNENSMYGMPVLLKDNINTDNMPTTAGAIALAENTPAENAFIVERLKDHKALILGKVNLSEWAYYFCEGCPLGYSAVGGQTLNPYGRKQFETGGSSSGSGVAVAANYAVAAVGTETAGSILSPSSKNSVVGLKPTVGLLSRSGIVPISSTLDTPGPMTKSVIDNAIFLNAMTGKDTVDAASVEGGKNYVRGLENATLEEKRIGVMKPLMADSLYNAAVEHLRAQGAEVIEFQPAEIPLDSFTTLLDADMKKDLPAYIQTGAGDNIELKNVEEIIAFNEEDSVVRAPYGQQLFEGIAADSTSAEELEKLSARLQENGRKFFDVPMQEHNLDAVLSINNYHAAYAAVAKYPALTVPAGYETTGEPKNVTFIAKPFEEQKLLELGAAFEKNFRKRKAPKNYN